MPEPISKILCVKNINIFKFLPRRVLEKIAEVHTLRNFEKGELIFTPGEEKEKVYLVEKGEVELYQLSANGRKIIIERIRQGGIFSNSSFAFAPEIEINDFAEVVEKSRLCIIKKEDFIAIMRKFPAIMLGLIQELSEKLNEADSRIRDLALGNSIIRLANELLRFSRKHGREINNHIRIEDKLTHENLADMIGVSRETVTKVIGVLKRKGFIDFDKEKRILINKNKLVEII